MYVWVWVWVCICVCFRVSCIVFSATGLFGVFVRISISTMSVLVKSYPPNCCAEPRLNSPAREASVLFVCLFVCCHCSVGKGAGNGGSTCGA